MPAIIVNVVNRVRNTAIPVHTPAPRTAILITLKHTPGIYIVRGGGVSQSGAIWFSASAVIDIGGVYKVGRASHQYWQSDVVDQIRVPASAVIL